MATRLIPYQFLFRLTNWTLIIDILILFIKVFLFVLNSIGFGGFLEWEPIRFELELQWLSEIGGGVLGLAFPAVVGGGSLGLLLFYLLEESFQHLVFGFGLEALGLCGAGRGWGL